MIGKAYKVVRQVYDQQRLFNDYPEYSGYKIYQMEEPPGRYSFQKTTGYLVTTENWSAGQTVFIDDDNEISPLRTYGSTPYISGSKVSLYRPGISLSQNFEITNYIPPENPVEKFGNIPIHRSTYYCYDAVQNTQAGYKPTLVRIFSDAIHFKGMEIPGNELERLPVRKAGEVACFLHKTHSPEYFSRLRKSAHSVATG
ncbi:MAG: hypothetical protein NDJ24_06755 [Alphaproteobacteria bacterium]|nr:hypothetical protein [Alphaproteobacteria bacterium]